MTPLRLIQVLVEAEKLLKNCECQMPPNLNVCEGDGPGQVERCHCFPLRIAVHQFHTEGEPIVPR